MKLLELQRDPAAFREALLIDTDAGPVPFAECMDDWQRADFEALTTVGAGQPGRRSRANASVEHGSKGAVVTRSRAM